MRKCLTEESSKMESMFEKARFTAYTGIAYVGDFSKGQIAILQRGSNEPQ